MSGANRQQMTVVAERLVDADPTVVWSLIADPARVGEWAGVAMVGYMGTELPKPGQTVFVRSVRRGRFAKTWRVNIEDWDAGTSVRCLLESDRAEGSVRFDLAVRPRLMGDAVATNVRLLQRMDVSTPMAGLVHAWVARGLKKKIDRIAKAVAR